MQTQTLVPETDARRRMRERYEETRAFFERHPEYGATLGALLGTVTACPHEEFRLPNVPLEEAHIHVFDDGDQKKPCVRCKRDYETVVEDYRKCLDREPQERAP